MKRTTPAVEISRNRLTGRHVAIKVGSIRGHPVDCRQRDILQGLAVANKCGVNGLQDNRAFRMPSALHITNRLSANVLLLIYYTINSNGWIAIWGAVRGHLPISTAGWSAMYWGLVMISSLSVPGLDFKMVMLSLKYSIDF